MISYDDLTPEQRQLYIQTLVAMARADGAVDEQEAGFLADIAAGCDVSEEALQGYLKGESLDPAHVPSLRNPVGALILRDAAAMAVVNNELTEAEEALLNSIGSGLGFSAEEIEEFLNWGFMGMQWQQMAIRLLEQYS
jgi:uncharacterized membrane protein YebE (DUF533 family)